MVRSAAVFALVLIVLSIGSLAQRDPSYEQQLQRPGGAMFSGRDFGGSLSGTVLSSDSKPLKDVRVDLRDTSGSTINSVYTNAAGMFEFSQVRSGLYEVVATSGLEQTQQRVEMDRMPSAVNLRLPVRSTPSDGNPANSISVAQYRVPAKARDELKSAREAAAKGKNDDADKHVAKALAIYPNYADALTLRAILKVDANDREGAVTDLQQAIQDDESCALAYIVMGAIFNTQGKFDDAIRSLERGEALAPDSWQAYFEMGKSLTAKAEYEPALRQLEKAQALSPKDYPPIHLVKARAMAGLSNYSDEMAELQQYLDKEPQGTNSAQARKMMDQARSFTQSSQKTESKTSD